LAKATHKFLVDFENKLHNDHDNNIYENVYDDIYNIIREDIALDNCTNSLEIYNLSFQKDKLVFLLELFFKDIKHVFFETHPALLTDSTNILLLNIYLYYLDLLSIIGLSGIYALFNKDETEAFYSVGNAKDICELIARVSYLIDDEFTKNVIDDINTIFYKSVLNKQIIAIKTVCHSEPEKTIDNNHILRKFHTAGSLTNKLFMKKDKNTKHKIIKITNK